MNDTKTSPPDDGISAEIWELLERAERRDETVMPSLRELLDSRPDLWRALSDAAGQAERTLL
jgi:hypothetical protein